MIDRQWFMCPACLGYHEFERLEVAEHYRCSYCGKSAAGSELLSRPMPRPHIMVDMLRMLASAAPRQFLEGMRKAQATEAKWRETVQRIDADEKQANRLT